MKVLCWGKQTKSVRTSCFRIRSYFRVRNVLNNHHGQGSIESAVLALVLTLALAPAISNACSSIEFTFHTISALGGQTETTTSPVDQGGGDPDIEAWENPPGLSEQIND